MSNIFDVVSMAVASEAPPELQDPDQVRRYNIMQETKQVLRTLRTSPKGSREHQDALRKLELIQIAKQKAEHTQANDDLLIKLLFQQQAERATAIALAKGSLAASPDQLIAALTLSLRLSAHLDDMSPLYEAWSQEEAQKILSVPGLAQALIAKGVTPEACTAFMNALIARAEGRAVEIGFRRAAPASASKTIAPPMPAPKPAAQPLPPPTVAPVIVRPLTPMVSRLVSRPMLPSKSVVEAQPITRTITPRQVTIAPRTAPVVQTQPAPAPTPVAQPQPIQQPIAQPYAPPPLPAQPQYAPAPMQPVPQYAPAPQPMVSRPPLPSNWVPPDEYDSGYDAPLEAPPDARHGPAIDLFMPEAYEEPSPGYGYPADDASMSGLDPVDDAWGESSPLRIPSRLHGGTTIYTPEGDWWDVYSPSGPGGPDPHAPVLDASYYAPVVNIGGCGCGG